MKLSTISKLRLGVVATALVGTIALTSAGLSGASHAAGVYGIQRGPYHQDVLPNGGLTGPIAPDANGG
jgi:hypothetical protein